MGPTRLEQLTLKDVFELYRQYRKVVVVSIAVVLTVAVLFQLTENLQVAKGSIVVGDAQNSSVQAYSSSVSGYGKTLSEGKKANSPLAKHFEFLKSRNFMEVLASKVIAQMQAVPVLDSELQLKLNEKFSGLQGADQQRKIMSYLAKSLQFKLNSDFELQVRALDKDAALATFAGKLALNGAVESLQDRESVELAKVEEMILSQRNQADAEIKRLDAELGKYKDHPEYLLALSSKDKMGEYISDLLVRENEIRLKIAENRRLIARTGNGAKGEGSRLYGAGGKVEMLRLENQELASRMAEIKSSLAKLTVSLKETTEHAQDIDSLRRKNEIEFAKYKEASNALANIEAAKQSLSSKFEVFEWPSRDTTTSQYPFLFVIGGALLLSQLIVFMVILMRWQGHIQPDPEPKSRNQLILLKDFEIQTPIVAHDNYKLGYSFDSKQGDLRSDV